MTEEKEERLLSIIGNLTTTLSKLDISGLSTSISIINGQQVTTFKLLSAIADLLSEKGILTEEEVVNKMKSVQLESNKNDTISN